MNTPAELRDASERRQELCIQYRESFFNIINFFVPAIHAAVVNRHRQRDTRLTAEAQNAIAAHRGTGVNVIRRRLKTLLALETILCTEYRNSYFAVINLIGTPVFQFVWDNHRQRDGVIEAEDAKVSDMIESIWDAAK